MRPESAEIATPQEPETALSADPGGFASRSKTGANDPG